MDVLQHRSGQRLFEILSIIGGRLAGLMKALSLRSFRLILFVGLSFAGFTSLKSGGPSLESSLEAPIRKLLLASFY